MSGLATDDILHPKYDIAFIGAMNEDIVVSGAIRDSVKEILDTDSPGWQHFAESTISDLAGEKIAHIVQPLFLKHKLGGAAFNAAQAASSFSPGLRLGMVGIAGTTTVSQSHIISLKGQQIDCTWLKQVHCPTALSISFVHDGDRTRFTSIGANKQAHHFLNENLKQLVEYLSKFKCVHITSFLDSHTPKSLSELVDRLVNQAPETEISLSLGSKWANECPQAAMQLLSNATLLHLSQKDFSLLGGKMRNENDKRVARRIFAQMTRPKNKALLVRRHGSILVSHSGLSGDTNLIEVENPKIPGSYSSVETPWANDKLTGLMLAAIFLPQVQIALAAKMGLAMASAQERHMDPDQPVNMWNMFREPTWDST